jgi:hypothetical protein
MHDSIPQTGSENLLSLGFDGTDQRVFIGDDPRFVLTQSLTIEAYIKHSAFQNHQTQILFRGDDRLALDPYLLGMYNNQLHFHVENLSGQIASVSAPIRRLNHWIHVAGTLDDASGALRLYVNGKLVAVTTTTIRPFAQLDPTLKPGVAVGNLQSDTWGHQPFAGLIDEVRLSNRALAPNEFLNSEPSRSTAVEGFHFRNCVTLPLAIDAKVSPSAYRASTLPGLESSAPTLSDGVVLGEHVIRDQVFAESASKPFMNPRRSIKRLAGVAWGAVAVEPEASDVMFDPVKG